MNKRVKSIILFGVAFLFLYISLSFLSQAQKIRALSLPEEKILQKLPPEIVFTTILLGGFRGILVDFLWMRAQKLQEEGKYFELVQLSDWIGLLEPKIPQIWIFNAWNLSYNISVEFPTPKERWNWVYQGIKLLRDRALKYLPHSPEIYRELSWIYFNKISSSIDEFSAYYKRTWAKIMQDALGDVTLDEMISCPSYQSLIKDKEVENIKTEMVVSFLNNFRYYFNEWDMRKRRMLLESILGEVVVYNKEKARVSFSIPLSSISTPIYVKEQPPASRVHSVTAVIPLTPGGGADGICMYYPL